MKKYDLKMILGVKNVIKGYRMTFILNTNYCRIFIQALYSVLHFIFPLVVLLIKFYIISLLLDILPPSKVSWITVPGYMTKWSILSKRESLISILYFGWKFIAPQAIMTPFQSFIDENERDWQFVRFTAWTTSIIP